MALWQKNGGPAQALPFSDIDPARNSWTDLAHNEEGRTACGWSEAVDPAPVRTITALAYKQRLTPQERIGIRAAAATDPVIADFLDLLAQADLIDLDHTDTINGCAYLVAEGLLTPERVAVIRA